jgi:hypothetical protein
VTATGRWREAWEDAGWGALTGLPATWGQGGSDCPAITGLSPPISVRGRPQSVPSTGHDVAVQSRTPVLLEFSVGLPSVTATGRWKERGRMPLGRR